VRGGYRLTSTWRLAAPVDRCWAVLADPALSWPRWWPGVTAVGVRAVDGLVGSAASLVFRSPLRYSLAVDLEVVAAEPGARVHVRASGDLDGVALARFTAPDPGRTRVDVLWRVTPTRRWMAVTGPVLAPVFVAAHAATMRAGERGLARHLAAAPA
jgi:uncharacterized protein YndB with AHSA1/START domain